MSSSLQNKLLRFYLHIFRSHTKPIMQFTPYDLEEKSE